jgi:hypoxanthine-DNA glycosylase
MSALKIMREFHPYPPFVPENTRILLLGSFPGRRPVQNPHPEDWSYGSERNQFWPLMRRLYGRELNTLAEKKQLFAELGIAVTDIILSCERSRNLNSDQNLINKVYNTDAIHALLSRRPVESIFFTGKGVRDEFEKNFRCPESVSLVVLPSPSPAYASLSFERKEEIYRQNFPVLRAV